MVSIAIPVYEMNSSGKDFLDISLSKICLQTFKDVEVVISDHSKDDEIKKLCDSYNDKLNILYLRNENNRGSSSANLNNALKNCSGKIIKILMQDEYLYDIEALEKINSIFEADDKLMWLVTGCVFGVNPETIRGSMLPEYTDEIVKAINTIGSPSVLTIRNSEVELFDEQLLWVMDCEYYKRIYDKFGPPHILNECEVFIIQHKDQVSSSLNEDFKKKEVEYLIEKYTNES